MYKRLRYFIITLTMALAILCFSKNKTVYAEDDTLGRIHQYFIDNPTEYERFLSYKSQYPYALVFAPTKKNPSLTASTTWLSYSFFLLESPSQWTSDAYGGKIGLRGVRWEFNNEITSSSFGTFDNQYYAGFNSKFSAYTYYNPILYSNYDLTPVPFYGVVLGGGDVNIGNAIYPHVAELDNSIPLVGLSYYGDSTSRNKTVFIPRFSLMTDASSDTINTDGTWNENYTVEYKLTLFVSTHEYANAIYNAYAENGKDVNNVRFQNALASLLQTKMPLGESTFTVSGEIHPFSTSDFVRSPEVLFYRDFSYYTDLASPITESGATQYDKNVLAPYVFRIKNAESRLRTSDNYGKTTVYTYNVAQDFLTFYTYAEEVNDDRNIAIESALADLQERYTELDTLFEQYKIDRQRLDSFSASESWYDIDIGKTAMQVIDIFDSMVDVVGGFADYTVMFMSWMPVSVLRLFIACLILNCIVSLYHALRG